VFIRQGNRVQRRSWLVTRSVHTVRMGSLGEFGRTAGAVHRLRYHLVWCPKYRQYRRPADHVLLVARCGPDASPARLAHQRTGTISRTVGQEFAHVSQATIGRYLTGSIAQQTTRPITGVP
jgi:REP element-mobilizing transposase RayT